MSDVCEPQPPEPSTEEKLPEVEEERPNLPQCENIAEMDESMLVSMGNTEEVEDPASMAEMEVKEEEEEAGGSSTGSGRKKRGRSVRASTRAPPKRKKEEEEDVCFICFDGGNLVLCDRRGCPKAYHAQCVGRDEAFFKSKGRWTCGWHICSICEKASKYTCYTCTFSLCKGCIKKAGFFCIRGNKGFCETCMRTVMLIEKNEQANPEMAGVDFDDKSSWEYLFKEYWLHLKGKLSVTFEEINKATNPSKESAPAEESSDELYDANDDKGSSSDSSLGHLDGSNSTRKRLKKRSRAAIVEENTSGAIKAAASESKSVAEGTEWASEALLELVAHMKNGDKSVLSEFDVQALLLKYIQQNNLRDPRRKSQIICDSRLENIFGKARVGHFEMLKLLEAHFLVKDRPPVFGDDNPGGIADNDGLQVEPEGHNDSMPKSGLSKKKKTRKKNEDRVPQTNLDDYAAIDIHNINLIYLRRNLMEDLVEDMEKFQDKVVGSFVRIRIMGASQKQDMYRLVQVVGTGKTSEPYKTGKRTTDVTLEILNLNKTEVITIDTISNQDFSEEECKRLRQSIKCGLISRLTVGEVQEKARALQAVRVNDWLETEILRLSHLRDRASEKGRRKELRECVEKLQLLNTPEERSRRLEELPEVHADPNMDPSHESDEDEGDPEDKKQDYYMRLRDSGYSRKGRELPSPGKGGLAPNDAWTSSRNTSTANWESNRNAPTRGVDWDKGGSATVAGEKTSEPSWNQGLDALQTSSWDMSKYQATASTLDTGSWNSQAVTRSAQQEKINVSDKIWHYQDPSGKIQGPFSMTQLCKWSTTGYFPAHLRIWKASAKQEDSILLTDALIGKFQKEPPIWESQQGSSSQPQVGSTVTDSRETNWEGGWKEKSNTACMDKQKSEGSWNWKDTGGAVNINAELVKNDGWGTQSSTWVASTTEVDNPKDGWSGSSSRGLDASRGSGAWSSQPPSPTPRSTQISGNLFQMPSHQGREGRGGSNASHQGREGQGGGNAGRWNSGQDHGNTWNTNRTTGFQSSNHGYEKLSSNWGSSGQSSGEGWNMQPESKISKDWERPSLVSVSQMSDGNKNDFSNLPTPTPKPSSGGWSGAQDAEKTWSSGSAVSSQSSSSGWVSASDPGGNVTQKSLGARDSNRTAGWGNQQYPPSPTPTAGGLGSNQMSSSSQYLSETTSGHGAGQPSPIILPEPVAADEVGRKDLTNLPTPTPNASRGGWAGCQGVENESAAISTASVQPATADWESARDSENSGANQPSATESGRAKTAASWDKQCPSPTKSLEWDSVSTFSPKTTETDGPHPYQVPPNFVAGQSISAPPAKDDFVGGVNVETGIDLDAGRGLEDKEQAPSEIIATDQHPMVPQSDFLGPESKLTEESAIKPAASSGANDPASDPPSGVATLGETDLPTADAPQIGEQVVTDVSILKSVISGNQTSGTTQTLVSAGTSLKPAFESHGWGSASAPECQVSGSGIKLVFTSGDPLKTSSVSEAPLGNTGATVNPSTVSATTLDDSNKSWTTPEENVNTEWGTANRGNTSMVSGATPQGNTSAGWGATQGNISTGWGATLPGNTSFGGGATSQGNTNKGWGATPQGNARADWEATPQENASAGWGATALGNASAGWGATQQGNASADWGATPQGNATVGWGVGSQGANMGMDKTTGSSMWGSQHKFNGERFSGQGERGFQSNNSGHGGGRPSWNRSSSFGRGGSSGPPPRGQRVCKFHESGHCKKGASCGYLHN